MNKTQQTDKRDGQDGASEPKIVAFAIRRTDTDTLLCESGKLELFDNPESAQSHIDKWFEPERDEVVGLTEYGLRELSKLCEVAHKRIDFS